MTPFKAYSQAQSTTASWSRIDLLLALYDGAIDRVEKGLAWLKAGDPLAARPLFARAQAMVLELAAGVNVEVGGATSANLLRLYEFFAHSLAGTEVGKLESVVRSMTTLRDGLRSIRGEAVELERSGAVPPLDGQQQVLAVG